VPVDYRLVERRIGDIESSLGEVKRLTGMEFSELTLDHVYSLRYNIIVLVESLVSLAIHILVEGYSYKPRQYLDAVEQLARRVGIGVECLEELKALIRLRNTLLHGYWAVDDRLVYESARRDFRCVEDLLARVREAHGGNQVL